MHSHLNDILCIKYSQEKYGKGLIMVNKGEYDVTKWQKW